MTWIRRKKKTALLVSLVLLAYTLLHLAAETNLSQQSDRLDFSDIYQVGDPDAAASGSMERHATWRPVCTQERTNFVYIKMHKSASETLSAVFRRFGFLRNLSFVLPARKNNNLGWPWPLVPGMYRPSKASGYNILCEHSVYSEEVYPALMPPDTVFTTSLREPLSHLQSAFSYFRAAHVANINSPDALSEFLKSPQRWDDVYKSSAVSRKRGLCVPPGVSVTKNAQALDLGFPMGFPKHHDTDKYRDQTQNSTFVDSWLASIRKRFKFVIITEYLHESLILWRRLMCWKIQDILYYSRNLGTYQKGSSSSVSLDPTLVEQYRSWSNIDVQLYNINNATLWRNIAEEGPDLWQELDVFNQIMRKVSSFCSPNQWSESLVIGPSKFNEEFSYRKSDCDLLGSRLMPELKRHYDSIKKTVPKRTFAGPRC